MIDFERPLECPRGKVYARRMMDGSGVVQITQGDELGNIDFKNVLYFVNTDTGFPVNEALGQEYAVRNTKTNRDKAIEIQERCRGTNSTYVVDELIKEGLISED